jgi:hypothetical protein
MRVDKEEFMKRGCLCLLLTLAFLSLPLSTGAQDTKSTSPPASQGSDDYAFRLTLFVVRKIEGADKSSSDPLAQAANELFAADKQEQIRRELERRIGSPGDPEKYEALLYKIDRKLSDKKISELRERLSRKGRDDIAGWPWPLCVVVGCK